MNTYKEHVVSHGENLSLIARKYGLISAHEIYFNPQNADFRKRNPNINLIKPGEILKIPFSLHELGTMLLHQKNIRARIENTYKEIFDEVDKDYKTVSMWSKSVDIASGVLTVAATGFYKEGAKKGMTEFGSKSTDKVLEIVDKSGVSSMVKKLMEIIKKGCDSNKLEGEALEKAAKELNKKVLKFSYDPILRIMRNSPLDNSLLIAIPQILVKSWFDMQSPSYWAGRITGVNPEEEYLRLKTELTYQRDRELSAIDSKIVLLEKAIRDIAIHR